MKILCNIKLLKATWKTMLLPDTASNSHSSSRPSAFMLPGLFFKDRILHFGYADSRVEYGTLVKNGCSIISAALQLPTQSCTVGHGRRGIAGIRCFGRSPICRQIRA